MNKVKDNYFNDFHDEKLKFKYKIADCDNITYKMNELHTPIKIVSIMKGGKNKKNYLFLFILAFTILFLIYV